MSEAGTSTRYEPRVIEARRQEAWRARDAFRTPPIAGERPHLYIKPSTPFTSSHIHIGSATVSCYDTSQITVVSIQVEEGRCWRCNQRVRLVQRPQRYLRISAYVQENDRRLCELENWDENSLASQRFVLGRVDGVELDLPPAGSTGAGGPALTVFTPHADALALARFVLLSPKHPDVEAWADEPAVRTRLEELRSVGLERGSRDAEAIPVIDTGRFASAPVGGHPLPVLISPVVDGRFGA